MYFTNHSPSVTFILFQSPLGTDDLMHSMRRLLQGGLEAESMMDENCVCIMHLDLWVNLAPPVILSYFLFSAHLRLEGIISACPESFMNLDLSVE